MKSNNFKHAYAFVLLGLMVAWAVFCVWMTWHAISLVIIPNPTVQNQLLSAINIIAAAGCDTLLGFFISANMLVIQHFFRKATPEDNPTVK